MATKIINISLPEELVEVIDLEAKEQYASRSDFIRQTLVERLALRKELQRIHKAVAASAKKVGINTEEDVARVIRELREGR